jgi:hypothetical protein
VIIADASHAPSRSTVASGCLAAIAVALVGTAAALYYAQAGLTLSHYDAKGHLVVARRVFDSLTPGWQQIGAVWLPLPHLLNMLPVQIDALYRTGLSAVVLSIGSAALAAFALAALVARDSGSRVAAFAAVGLLALNPNTLYLQSTPMTEPLLLGLMLLATWLVREWLETDPDRRLMITRSRVERAAGAAIFLACWTRYEAWPVTGALLALSWMARLRQGERWRNATRRTLRLAAYPAAAVVVFLVNSRVTVGAWFVSSGFFVPENPALNDPAAAARQVVSGAAAIGGVPLVAAGMAAAVALAAMALSQPSRAGSLVLLAPLAAAALPWYAFVQGHPFRVRYMVVQVAALALVSCAAAGRLRRAAGPVALGLLAVTLYLRPPLDASAAMVREAQWDRPNAAARAAVTRVLAARHDGTPILASMGSLGHYMQELSHAGIHIRDFVHEGNGELWRHAFARPAAHVRWVLIEERAEGGTCWPSGRGATPASSRASRAWRRAGGSRSTRGSVSGINPPSEAHPHREVHRPPAQVDLVAQEAVGAAQREIPFAGLVAEFAAEEEGVRQREPQAAEDDRRGGRAALHVAVAEQRVVERIDELTRLAVAPVQNREAAAEVRLQAVDRAAERKDPHRRGDGHDAQPQILLDLAAVRADQVAIHGRHRAPIEPGADAGFEEPADAKQPVGSDRRAVEVADLERQRIEIAQIRHQHVPLDPAVFALHDEAADVETHDLRLRPCDRREDQEPDHQHREPRLHPEHHCDLRPEAEHATCHEGADLAKSHFARGHPAEIGTGVAPCRM